MIWPGMILEQFSCLSPPCCVHMCGRWGDLIWMEETCWSVTFPSKTREREYSSFLGTLLGLTIGFQPRNMLHTLLVFTWKSVPYPGGRLSHLKSKAHLTITRLDQICFLTEDVQLPQWGTGPLFLSLASSLTTILPFPLHTKAPVLYRQPILFISSKPLLQLFPLPGLSSHPFKNANSTHWLRP